MHRSSDDIDLDDWLKGLSRAVTVLAKEGKLPADYTSESLIGFWEWMRDRCELRTPSSDPVESNPDKVPAWAKHPGLQRLRSVVTVPTLELIGYMARYYGECLQRAVPEARWRIWQWGVKGHAVSGEGQPALFIPGPGELQTTCDPVFPIRDIDVMVMRTIAPNPHPEPTDVIAMYRMRVEALQEGVQHLTANDRT